MRRIEADGGENGQKLVVEIVFNPFLLRGRPIAAAVKMNACTVKFGLKHIIKQIILLADQRLRLFCHRLNGFGCGFAIVEQLMRTQFVFAFQPRHTHFKKFVQIGRHDAQETQTFQQRNFRILRLSQYTTVKRQQAEFSAENAVLLGHGLLLKHQSLTPSSITFCRRSVRFQTASADNLISI